MKREPQRRDEVLGEWELNDLLHPAQAFESPAAVLEDPDLTVNEKRAILASWASDTCAVEAAPNGGTYRRVLRRKRILGRGRRDTSAGGTALQ